MVDMPNLPKYKDIPYGIRKNPERRWNFFRDLMIGAIVYNPETNEFDKVGSSNEEPAEDEFTPVTYNFTSYADSEGETEWGTGTVETTGIIRGNYTQVEVKTNSSNQSFVGQKFFVISSAKTDGTIYTVYNDAGRNSAGFYISINED